MTTNERRAANAPLSLPRLRAGPWVEWSAVFVLAWLVARWLTDPIYGPYQTDYLAYFYPAGRQMLQGLSPYTFVTEEGTGFVFPPWLALLLVPYALLPLGVSAACWLATNLALLGLSVVLTARLCDIRAGLGRLLLVTLALIL